MLAQPAQTSKELWLRVKPLVRAIESDDGVLIIDDSITEKPSEELSDEEILARLLKLNLERSS